MLRTIVASASDSGSASGPSSATSYSEERSLASVPVESSAELPQLAQKLASAASGCPQVVHATTGSSPTGRPQFAQKCEPQTVGAPHAQREAGARLAHVAASSFESSPCRRSSSSLTSW